MSEALETWPVDMLGKILPRHLQIIFEINDYFLKTLQEQYPNDTGLLSRTSIIDESNGRRVRMAWLAVVVSKKVNGVSELHSNLMVQSLFADFAAIFPMRFTNVTQRRDPTSLAGAGRILRSPACWMKILARPGVPTSSQLSELEQHIDYPKVNQAVHHAKLENKKRLAAFIAQNLNVVVNPTALFDVQIKRIHEYKRQLMNVLHVIARYNRIKADPSAGWVPRVNIFAGKAASAYYMAKHIIQPDQRRGGCDQQRSADWRQAKSGVYPELQREPGADDHSGGGSV
ncbi:Maltodextrin phosphorylase [Kluyvera cryocrescens]|uniref:Alpha-1,4 glucan phosphorylase n=1 Tax=Kluyvera cryocrescens TaxID=580 RepID=A0A485AEK7_KLUCR|nr:Maltodextrin phosphorylase [Kluyvera cryocrescens]